MKRRLIQFFMIPVLLMPLGIIAKADAFEFLKPDCSKKEYSTKELMARSKPGVLMIETDNATGSGLNVSIQISKK